MTAKVKGRKVVGVTGADDDLPIIGSLALLSMPEKYVKATKALHAWATAGLDPADLPDVRSAAHCFMDACRSVEERRRNGKDVQIKVDLADDNDSEVVYQITRLVRDREAQEIEHRKGMTLVLDKSTEDITVRQLEDYVMLDGDEEARIRAHFKAHGKDLHTQKIRNAVTKVIERTGATNVKKRAGVYFVPRTSVTLEAGTGKRIETPTKALLESIQHFFDEMYDGEATLWLVPLMHDDAQKDMVGKHFALNVNEALREQMEKAVNRVRAGKGRGVRAELVMNLYNQRRQLVAQVDQYDQLVTLERTEIDANIRDLDKALADLQDLADEE